MAGPAGFERVPGTQGRAGKIYKERSVLPFRLDPFLWACLLLLPLFTHADILQRTFLCGRVIVREPVVFTHHSWRFGIWAKSRASGKEKEHKTGVTFSFTLSGCARVLLFFIFYSFVGAPGLLCIWLGAVFLLV